MRARLSREEAMKALGVSSTTLWRLQTRGKLAKIDRGHTIQFRREDIEEFLAARAAVAAAKDLNRAKNSHESVAPQVPAE